MSDLLLPQTLASDATPIELRIPASSEWVRVARLTVAGVASRLPFGIDAVEDIKLAVTEAINNAIQHAPVQQAAPLVTIGLEPRSDGLWIRVADQGRMPDGLPSETTLLLNQDELPENGLGLLLIRSLMDEVDHECGPHADTVVRMFKKLPVRD